MIALIPQKTIALQDPRSRPVKSCTQC
jgi:hypothetical protein